MRNLLTSNSGHILVKENIADHVESNLLANAWLVILAGCLLVTFFCTVVLIAWPIVAHMIAG
ncbi:hypothetical protein [Geopsychrobacter electrodiphilus]|uniref:hypothetical protein n=1 Tax=Geopsychrobacter electrodiphilus TaxID=225196 RepID=UPI00036D4CBD|nr:hypothetical protein [Geopsychrobacter electrodiphilus]